MDRRGFLVAGSGVAAGAILGPRSDGAPIASPGAALDGVQPAADAGVSQITAETIAQAEKLSGIEFTAAEREMMVKTLPDAVAGFASRQKLGVLPNELAPGLVFDPRAGMGLKKESGWELRITRSGDDATLPANDVDIAYAPVSRVSRWIERRELTSARLTSIYLERLKRLDPKVKAVVTLTEELANRQARRADDEIAGGKYRGPLHGIPYGAKDLLDTAGVRTTWGAEPWVDRVPANNAAVIDKLEAAGAVLVAKLSLGALAYGDIWFEGRTNSPWKLDEGSSGSSAGSAAATAAGMVAFAIGTETYGSILSPSMRCGTTGLRPTFGRVSRAGAMALCWSLDKIGPICRTVEDAVLVLAEIQSTPGDVEAGAQDQDPSLRPGSLMFDAGRSVMGMRVGYNPAWFEKGRANELDRKALEAMRSLGVEMVEFELPEWPYDCLLPQLVCEAASAFEELTRAGLDDKLSWQAPEAWPNTFRQSWFIPANELIQTDRFRRMVMKMMADRFEKVEAIFAPSFAGSLCLITNFTGHPQLTLRCGVKEDGTPHGVSVWGRLDGEGRLCELGKELELALGVWERRPGLD
ncbi:MAG: amidase [Phycisphaerales bacterium]|nr:amidase [Phycisphaerales bacterium]